MQEENFKIEDYIKCYICLEKLTDATMCPHCNRLSCQKCIQKWLIEKKSQCPLCRMNLKFSQLISCKFMNGITQILHNYVREKNLNEKCDEHKIDIIYFCNTCSKSVCSDCVMFTPKHKEHEIKHLDEIYKSHLELVKGEMNDMKGKLEKLNQFLGVLEDKIDYLRTTKQDKINELEELHQLLKTKLDIVLNEKLSKLNQAKNILREKIDNLDNIKFKISRSINDYSHSHLISKSDEIINQIKSINYEGNNDEDITNISTNFDSEIIPSYFSSTFEIPNYKSSLRENNIIYSDELITYGIRWRLKVYPNGNGVSKGESISVFLEVIDGLMEKSKYHYKIELVNFEKNPNHVKEFASEFIDGECWGYHKFYSIEKIEKEGFIEKNSGKIKILFSVRAMDYIQLCRDQKRYIEKLTNLINQKNEVENFEEKKELINENMKVDEKFEEIKEVQKIEEEKKDDDLLKPVKRESEMILIHSCDDKNEIDEDKIKVFNRLKSLEISPFNVLKSSEIRSNFFELNPQDNSSLDLNTDEVNFNNVQVEGRSSLDVEENTKSKKGLILNNLRVIHEEIKENPFEFK